MDAPIGIRWNVRLAKKVVFTPCRDPREFYRARRGERERGVGVLGGSILDRRALDWRWAEHFDGIFGHGDKPIETG